MERNSDGTSCSRGLPKKVGYGCPPEASRFKPGVSGNPKGRPMGSLNVATVFAQTLRERIVIRERGRQKTVTKLQAAVKQLVNKAASGEIHAIRKVVDLIFETEARQDTSTTLSPAITASDQEVIEGIWERLKEREEMATENDGLQEANDVDDQRG